MYRDSLELEPASGAITPVSQMRSCGTPNETVRDGVADWLKHDALYLPADCQASWPPRIARCCTAATQVEYQLPMHCHLQSARERRC